MNEINMNIAWEIFKKNNQDANFESFKVGYLSAKEENQTVYLTRRNLKALISKLDRLKEGEHSHCIIVKNDDLHPTYPQTMKRIFVRGVENEDYYIDRKPGAVHPIDEQRIKED